MKSIIEIKDINREQHIFIVCICGVFSCYFTFVFCVFLGVFTESPNAIPLSILDVFKGVANIATGAGFLLAARQYIKSAADKRQEVIGEEAKTTVKRMIDAVAKLEHKNVTLSNLSSVINELNNHAHDFNLLFAEMTDDVVKSMVRMNWQHFYFDHLLVKFGSLEGLSMLEKLMPTVHSERSPSISNNTLECFKKYALLKAQLDLLKKLEGWTKSEIHMLDPLNNLNSVSLDMFIQYFFDGGTLKELLTGTINLIDIRAKAPLIAALAEFKGIELRLPQ